MHPDRPGCAVRLARQPEELADWLLEEPRRAALVRFLAQWSRPVYLVGGSVRDALLGRDTVDLDFAVDGSALALARAVADRHGGALVVMDSERDMARVVLHRGNGNLHWDYSALRAGTIEDDLRARDLTVNALALALSQPEEMIDPAGGYEDLQRGTLRAASDGAFCDDPVRVLRLARFRGDLGFAALPATRRLARQAAGLLPSVSPERLRDEIFAILALPTAASSLWYLWRLWALRPALHAVPGLDEAALAAGLRRLGALERWAGGWSHSDLSAVSRTACGSEVEARHAIALASVWRQVLAGGRTRWQVAKWAALLVALAPEDVAQGCVRLRLSNAEARWARDAVTGAQALQAGQGGDGAVAVYRYYRQHGEAGVAGAVLALAGGSGEPAELALDSWLYRQERVVNPPRLVTGRDLMKVLGVGAGPIIGRALEMVREAQVAGVVASRAEALAYLREQQDKGV